jgi:hypothetical protein
MPRKVRGAGCFDMIFPVSCAKPLHTTKRNQQGLQAREEAWPTATIPDGGTSKGANVLTTEILAGGSLISSETKLLEVEGTGRCRGAR